MKEYNLFLDDFRKVGDVYLYVKNPIYINETWEHVKSYEEFVNIVEEKLSKDEWPKWVSFDHDLSTEHYKHQGEDFPYNKVKEMTGLECAKWFIRKAAERKLPMPQYYVHSLNPYGAMRIQAVLDDYVNHKIIP